MSSDRPISEAKTARMRQRTNKNKRTMGNSQPKRWNGRVRGKNREDKQMTDREIEKGKKTRKEAARRREKGGGRLKGFATKSS